MGCLKIGQQLCEVCGIRPAVHKCRLCGRSVCDRHFIKSEGICLVCKELMCEVCGRRLSIDSCIICGKLICRSCSIELQPGIRLCLNCFNRLPQLISKYPRLSYILRYLKKAPQHMSGDGWKA